MSSFLDNIGLGHYTKWLANLLNKKANIDSPSFTGVSQSTTPTEDSINTQIVTVGFVNKHHVIDKYTVVEYGNADDYVQYGRYEFVNSDGLPDSQKYYVDVDVDDNKTIRQFASLIIDPPLLAVTGTLVVSGNVDVDLTVNGNVSVSGTISGNVVATGTITYGSLIGTIKENAVVNRCDISVDGGELTIDSGIVYDDDNTLYVNGSITNGSDCITEVYCNLKVSPSSGNSLICSGSNSNFTIKSGSNVTIVSSSYCINMTSSSTLTLDRGSIVSLERSGSSSSGRGINLNSLSYINLNGVLSINDLSYGIYINGSSSGKSVIGGYGNVTINNTTSYGVYLVNSSCTTNGVITINDSRYGLYLASSTYTCNGTTYINNSSSSSVSKSSSSVINGTGVIYVNDDVYYDGSVNGLTDFGLEMDRLSEFDVD